MLYNKRPKPGRRNAGFTLLELIVAASIGAFISILTGSIILDNIKSTARGEALQRLKEDWNRATTLIQSEIAISQSLQSSGLRLTIPEQKQCPYLSNNGQLKLRINLPGKLPDILYGTQRIGNLPSTELNQWIGGNNAGVLIRCGPKLIITSTGKDDYVAGQDPQESIILDDLSLKTDDGLKINQTAGDSKLVRFELIMQANNARYDNGTSKPYQIGSRAFSRINPVQLKPDSQSICTKICNSIGMPCSSVGNTSVITLTSGEPRKYTVPAKNILKSNMTTVCTNRAVQSGDSIIANDSNYVIDASPTPTNQDVNSGVTITGGQLGRNILLGTSLGDKIIGGPFDDVIVGRNGDDILNGAEGNDNFLPWDNNSSTNAVIFGGLGLDSVYIYENSTKYEIPSSCNTSQCNLDSPKGGTLTMQDVEILIFDDRSVRLSDQ